MGETVIVDRNIVYGRADDEYLTADLYKCGQNKCDQSSQELPIIVLVHGGAWQTGSKEMYADWGKALAMEGYFVMAINYRLASSEKASFPGVVRDLESAINWLVENSNRLGLDINKIGLIGDSAGAHIASLFALKKQSCSYKICAVAGIYGVYDIPAEVKDPVSPRAAGMFKTLFGKDLAGNEQLYQQASPSSYIDLAVTNPTFDTSFYLVYGAQDKVINPNQSRAFAQKLKTAGIAASILEINDVGHFWFNPLPGISGGRVQDYPNKKIYSGLIEFLQENIKNSVVLQFSKQRLRALAASENLEMYI